MAETESDTEPVTGDSQSGGIISNVDEESDSDVDEEGDSDICLLYTSPSPRDRTRSRMPSSA